MIKQILFFMILPLTLHLPIDLYATSHNPLDDDDDRLQKVKEYITPQLTDLTDTQRLRIYKEIDLSALPPISAAAKQQAFLDFASYFSQNITQRFFAHSPFQDDESRDLKTEAWVVIMQDIFDEDGSNFTQYYMNFCDQYREILFPDDCTEDDIMMILKDLFSIRINNLEALLSYIPHLYGHYPDDRALTLRAFHKVYQGGMERDHLLEAVTLYIMSENLKSLFKT